MKSNDEDKETALELIDKFEPDLGGSRLYDAVGIALNSIPNDSGMGFSYKKMIIMISDFAEVPDELLDNIAWVEKSQAKIHAFGIGNNCNEAFHQLVANFG